MAALCAALLAAAPAHAGPTAAATTANPFDGAGVFVDNLGNFPGPAALADELQANHFSWVALHAHNGRVQYAPNDQWLSVLRAHGLEVGLWGWEDSEPLLAAQLAVFQVRLTGADFYIADAEWDYERAAHTAGWYRSRIFASTFRRSRRMCRPH